MLCVVWKLMALWVVGVFMQALHCCLSWDVLTLQETSRIQVPTTQL